MKATIISILAAGVLVAGAIVLTAGPSDSGTGPANTVSVVDGTQVIALTAKGRYSPSVSTARANIPTVLRMKTSGTFDCSSALVIPALGYSANLPPTGITDIKIPPQKAGATLRGMCAMGMYTFAIDFM